MSNKTILILSDGMRPDAVMKAGHPVAERFMKECRYSLTAQTVLPSVTLPCHMSLMHSVPPERHGNLTNTFFPMVRPVNGIFEVLRSAGKHSGVFYMWEELRDLWRPDSIAYSGYVSGNIYREKAAPRLTEDCIRYIKDYEPDFVFLYFAETDAMGHGSGWMGERYMYALDRAWNMIGQVDDAVDGYNIIVTSDHGGHERNHGTDLPEDMTIPIFIKGEGIIPGKFDGGSILDIAPTIAKLCEVNPDAEWEGKSLV